MTLGYHDQEAALEAFHIRKLTMTRHHEMPSPRRRGKFGAQAENIPC